MPCGVQGAAFDVPEAIAEEMLKKVTELEKRNFALDRPRSLPMDTMADRGSGGYDDRSGGHRSGRGGGGGYGRGGGGGGGSFNRGGSRYDNGGGSRCAFGAISYFALQNARVA